MSLDRTLGVMIRVLRQLRHDRRTLVLVLLVPPILLWLVSQIFDETPETFRRVGPMMLGIFPFILMFLITSIATLRERTQGTLDRLMVSPLGRGDLMTGYALAFLVVTLVQALLTVTVGVGLLGIPNNGTIVSVFVLVLLLALLGITMGLFLSAFARTEFQAVQFLPAAVLPQIFFAGLLVPVDRMPAWLQAVAYAMPLRYGFAALNESMLAGSSIFSEATWIDFMVTLLAPCIFLVLGWMTLRRSSND